MIFRKGAKWLMILVCIGFFGGIGGLVLDRVVLPWLSVQNGLSHVKFLKRAADNVTIVNKTEQITVREDDSLDTIVSQAATTVVTVVMRPKDALDFSVLKGSRVSGVLLTNDGIIATYRVDGIPKPDDQVFSTILFDGSIRDTRFIGWDSLTNLAFFRIDISDAPAIALADSDGARVGKKLIAIAQGDQARQNRFWTGVLGAHDATLNLSGKTVSSSEKWEGVLRMSATDDATNFVGSPVVQYNGEMLGLIGTLSLDNALETFILPAKAVRQSLDFILSETSTTKSRPFFGVYYLPLSPAQALLGGISEDHGAWVYSPSGRTGLAVIAGSPADLSELEVNDIIVAVNGTEINLSNPLSVVLSKYRKGDILELGVIRGGQEKSIAVKL